MCECRNGLHFDRVTLFQRMIENAGRIDHLPAQIFVIGMTNQQRLCRERVRLNVDVGSSHFVQKRALKKQNTKKSGGKNKSFNLRNREILVFVMSCSRFTLPTFGKPVMSNVRSFGSIDGRRAKC